MLQQSRKMVMQSFPGVLDPFSFKVGETFSDYEGIAQLSVQQLLKDYGINEDFFKVDLELPLFPLVGHLTHLEMMLLVTVIKTAKAASFFEIGTFDGSTVLNLLRNCSHLEDIVTVDLPDDVHLRNATITVHNIDRINSTMLGTVAIGSRFASHPKSGKVTQIRKDSATLDSSDLNRDAYDCFFVDGCHTFEYCKSDSEFAFRNLSERGFVIWHDYGKLKALSGVTRYLLELAASGDYKLFWLRTEETITSLVIGFRSRDFAKRPESTNTPEQG